MTWGYWDEAQTKGDTTVLPTSSIALIATAQTQTTEAPKVPRVGGRYIPLLWNVRLGSILVTATLNM